MTYNNEFRLRKNRIYLYQNHKINVPLQFPSSVKVVFMLTMNVCKKMYKSAFGENKAYYKLCAKQR